MYGLFLMKQCTVSLVHRYRRRLIFIKICAIIRRWGADLNLTERTQLNKFDAIVQMYTRFCLYYPGSTKIAMFYNSLIFHHNLGYPNGLLNLFISFSISSVRMEFAKLNYEIAFFYNYWIEIKRLLECYFIIFYESWQCNY
jgi:hypothetical protein